ncbi:hypothetical protein ACSBR2_036131 [Camellia fascicularis]
MAMMAVKVVLEKLGSLIAEEAQFLGGVGNGVAELRDDLESMRSFLQDAEARSESDKGVQTWVKQVRDVAYNTKDILEEFLHRLSPPQGDGFFQFLRKGYHHLRQLRARHGSAVQVEAVKRKVKAISERRNAFSFKRIEEATSSAATTTQTVKKYFDRHAWITVSQSITAVELLRAALKDFLEETKEPIPEGIDTMDERQLINKLRGYLQQKRYVVVFDDNKHLLEWKKVHDSLSVEVKNNSSLEMLERILLLSYIDLPYHLKCCFLYLSVFPEGYLIKRMKIIWLWVVERFVEEKPGLTAEEVAEDYLNELVSRSMIQVVQKDNFNRVRTCCVHDIMREIIQLKSRDESFAMILLNDRRMSTDEKIHRMSIHANCKEELPSDMRFTSLRSLLVFVSTRSSMSLGKTFFKGFKLLGVLELELAPLYEFPPELTEMIHLRYLSLRSTMIRKLPESIGKLKKLEILDLEHCLMTCISSLPNGILKLKHLCQLRGYGYCFESSTMFASTYGMNLPGKIGELTNLQKLGNVEVNDNGDMLRELGKLTQLRRLGILKLTQENGMELCSSLEKLKHLTALYTVSISTTEPLHLNSLSSGTRFLQRLYLKSSLPTLPKWIASLQYLAKLVLQHSNLNDDPLKSLQGLPNLVVLELREAFVGEELCCNIGGYPRLKKLSLQQLSQLKRVQVEQGAMPGLRGLDIAACEKLEMVPLGIEHLRNLQRLMVWFMPWRFYQTIERPHGEDFWKVQHVQTIEAIY